ncbi:two-pore potassium channel 1 [Quercus suber]|uniref:Two-pore potassium channel 1 n=1 Tax=Quercus suber TaxID=58331 RepID=A0AAW0KYU0_QUESU
MAFNGAEKLTTLSGLEEPTPHKQIIIRKMVLREEYMADSVFPKANGTAPTLQSEFNSVKLEPAYKQVGILFGIYMVVGTLCFYFLSPNFKGEETNGLVDSIYYVASTMTTVGNGDLVPDNGFTKLLSRIFAGKWHWSNLEAADLDGDRVVNSSEYILYKLKEMGKITQEDISLVMKDLEDLDQSGS